MTCFLVLFLLFWFPARNLWYHFMGDHKDLDCSSVFTAKSTPEHQFSSLSPSVLFHIGGGLIFWTIPLFNVILKTEEVQLKYTKGNIIQAIWVGPDKQKQMEETRKWCFFYWKITDYNFHFSLHLARFQSIFISE